MVRLVAGAAAIAAALVIFLPAGARSADCTTTVASLSALTSAVASAQPGTTVCLADGSYGSLSLNASKAAPGVTVSAEHPGKATIGAVNLSGSGLTVSQFNSGGFTIAAGSSRMRVDHNDIRGGGFGVFLYGDAGVIRDVQITGNHIYGAADRQDAIRLHNFASVLVQDNEVQGINETGDHNDVLQTVHGGSDLTFTGNYVHDNVDGQGFFVKDGQVTGVTVTNNLFVREPGRGREISVQEASNVRIDHNTGVQVDQTIATTGTIGGSCAITNNVWPRAIELQGACPTSGNVIGGSPAYTDAAHDNYRIASGAGVNWAPADKTFGPGGDSGGGSTPPPPPPGDTTAPDTTITSGPNGSTTATSASFAFSSSESGSTFECKLDAGSYAACTSPKSYSGVSTGSHTFSVRATDAAGNTDASPATRTWTVQAASDGSPPETTFTGGPTGPTNDTTPTFSFTSTEAGSTFACRVDSAAYASCTSPWTTTALTAGSHSVSVRATDASGNTDASPATRSFVVDVTAPHTTITSAPPTQTSATDASVAFTVDESPATSECRLDSGAWSPCASPYRVTGLGGGSHTIGVRSTDAAGNIESPGASATWTVAGSGGGEEPPPAADAPPDVELTAPSVGSLIDGWTRLAASATDDHGIDRVEFWVDSSRDDSDDSAPYTAGFNADRLRGGIHTVSARAFDSAGQPASSAVTVRTSRRASGWAQLSSVEPSEGATRLTGQTARRGRVRVTLTWCRSSRNSVADRFTLQADANGRLDAVYAGSGRCVLLLEPLT